MPMLPPPPLGAMPAPPVSPPSPPEPLGNDPGIDVTHYLHVLRRHGALIAALVVVATLGSAVHVLRTVRVYTAQATILVEPHPPQVLDIPNARSEAVDDETRHLRTQYQILKSRALAAQVIRDRGLRSEPLLGGRPARADTDWSTLDPGIVDRYMAGLAVEPVAGTRLVQIAFTSPDRAFSARIANAHAEAYVQQGLRLRASSNEAGLDFLRDRLVELKDRLEESEAALNAYRWQEGILAVDDKRENIVVERLDELTKQLSLAETDRLALEAEVRTIESEGVETLPEVVKSGLFHELHVHLAVADSDYAKMAAQFKPTYPAVLELQRKTETLRRHLEAETARVAESVRTAYHAARDKEERLRAAVDAQKNEALRLKDAAVEYTILAREVDTNRALHDSVLQRMKAMTVVAEGRTSSVSLVDRAVPPVRAANPPRVHTVLLAVLLAAAAGIVIAFARDALDDSIKTADEVELYGRLPNLGVVPQMGARTSLPPRLLDRLQRGREADGAAVVLARQPDAALIDSYRQIRTSLLLSRPGGPPRTILVTSALDGEGKTLTTANLAVAFGQIGGSVLVIDADLRRPTCHRLFGVPHAPGLTELLSGQASVEQVVRRVDGHGLFVIPAGGTPPNPTELVGSPEMRALLADAAKRYDYVVVDSPAAFGVADAVVLSTLVEGVVLVVRGQRTPRRLLGMLRARLAYARAPVLGVVLNGADAGSEPYSAYYRAALDVTPPDSPGSRTARAAA